MGVSTVRAAARWVSGVLAMTVLQGCVTTKPQPPATVPATPTAAAARYETVSWAQVEGWQTDQPEQAWGAFLQTCRARGTRPEWQQVCLAASTVPSSAARAFFERNFTPYRIVQLQDGQRTETGLITGYYEPLLRGARKRSAAFPVPLYAPPDDLLTIDLGSLYPELKGKRVRGRLQGKTVVPYYTRAELGAQGRGSLQGKELLWVDNAVEAFFLEVQGSGRVQFGDGSMVRLAYADQNGQPYRSIGRYLVEQGQMTLDQASAQRIRSWIEAHPQRRDEVLDVNPSVVFFRQEKIDDPAQGPKGALAVPLTAGRSIAVDPQFVPLGAPVFLATTYPASTTPLTRLVLAQDTGGAIRGINRADLFWGFGPQAGEAAGKMKQPGRLWLLWPRNMPLPAGLASK